MVFLRYCLLAVCCAVVSTARASDPEARAWLERMSRALSTQSYDGRFFHLRQSRSESMRIIHRVDSRGRITERLVSLDGSGREIVRTVDEVICYLPDKKIVVVEKRTDSNTLVSALPVYNDALESSYRIERSGGVVKALGRKTQIIEVQPRDQYRYGYRLWLDQETAMPLKSQLCDNNGNVIEQILFAELNLRDRIPADEIKASVTGEGYRWLRQDDTATPVMANAAMGWNVTRLPAGFRLTTWRMQIIAGSPTPVRHLVYSDGLASVSVFIEPRGAPGVPMHGLAKVGAAFAFSRDLDGHQVTAVGEVPAATVEAIAAGVRQTQDGQKSPSSATAVPSQPPPTTH
ncbi:MAG TPA: MucB/RseB C-terminal domain-containing protein [Povalibacter sp.]